MTTDEWAKGDVAEEDDPQRRVVSLGPSPFAEDDTFHLGQPGDAAPGSEAEGAPDAVASVNPASEAASVATGGGAIPLEKLVPAMRLSPAAIALQLSQTSPIGRPKPAAVPNPATPPGHVTPSGAPGQPELLGHPLPTHPPSQAAPSISPGEAAESDIAGTEASGAVEDTPWAQGGTPNSSRPGLGARRNADRGVWMTRTIPVARPTHQESVPTPTDPGEPAQTRHRRDERLAETAPRRAAGWAALAAAVVLTAVICALAYWSINSDPLALSTPTVETSAHLIC